MTQIAYQLQEFFEDNLPITDFMGLILDEYKGNSLSLQAPLAPNVNDKRTVFGGSLYNACSMACWGFAYLKALEAGIDGEQVIADGSVKYFRPVTKDFTAICHSPGDEAVEQFIDGFKRYGKGKIDLAATIECNGEVAVEFKGSFAVLQKS